MSFNLFIVKSPSYIGRSQLETLEALMSIGLFDIDHRVVFFEAGISWLLENQQPTDEKSVEKQLNALPMYGTENLFFVQQHAESLFPGQQLNENVAAVSEETLISWMHKAEKTEVFG